MKYVFVSLGFMESFGFRLGGAGLGNILFPWARSLVYAKIHDSTNIKTTWLSVKAGTVLRSENDKRFYSDIFTNETGIYGIRKFLLLNFSNKIKYFSGMEGLFSDFVDEQEYIKQKLLSMTNPSYIQSAKKYPADGVGVHIRLGDFSEDHKEKKLRDKAWNYRIPIDWYIDMLEKVCRVKHMPIYIFSDGDNSELSKILALPNVYRVHYGSSISDMLALSNSKLLISSASTFSMWASFLGQIPTIWFPGQHRQRLISNKQIFEGELDYDSELPKSLIDFII